MGETMIERYGHGRVRQVVSDFYGRVLASPRLALYFDGVDIHTLVAHQSVFLEAVMGSPQSHSAEDIRRIHDHLGISSTDFQEMIDLLGQSLQRFGVDASDQQAVQDRYLTYEDQVVSTRR
ncbi:MAG TPA: group 1 truncated hemoglobin [Acidimicrobiia bacterium]|jgi:hemoglobin|nr:group 1 truncated hemoglobin [Acidimicrobiia bacterium]